MSEPYKFGAFISYSHRDREWAGWLHRRLEAYRVPKPLVGRRSLRGDVIPPRIGRVFVDREELASAHELGQAIEAALAASAVLIVICSPEAAQSRWVNQEILSFKKAQRDNRVLALIVAGEPFASNKPGEEHRECFPPALRYQVDGDGNLTARPAEPLAADARDEADGKAYAFLKLCAGIIAVEYNDLRQREAEAGRRRMLGVAALFAVATMVFGALAIFANSQRILAVEQRKEAWIGQSRLLAFIAGEQLDSGHAELAKLLAIEALPKSEGGDERPVVPEAAAILERAVRADRAAGVMVQDQHAYSIAWDPTGSAIAAGTVGGKLYIYDAHTSQLTFRQKIHDDVITGLAWDNEGSRLITAGGKNAKLWDYPKMQLVATLTGHTKPIWSAVFSPDDLTVVTLGFDNTARLWDPGSGKLLHVLKGFQYPGKLSRLTLPEKPTGGGLPSQKPFIRKTHEIFGSMLHAAFTPDGSKLVTIGAVDPQAVARLWDVRTGAEIGRFRGEFHSFAFPGAIAVPGTTTEYVAISPTGKFVAASSSNAEGEAYLWSLTDQRLIAPLAIGAHVIRFSPDGKFLATADDNGTIIIYDGSTGRTLHMLKADPNAITDMEFSPDGMMLGSSSQSGLLRLWYPQTGALVDTIHAHSSLLQKIAFNPQGSEIATISLDATLRLWFARRGQPDRTITPGGVDFFFSKDGKFISTPALDGSVYRIDTGLPVTLAGEKNFPSGPKDLELAIARNAADGDDVSSRALDNDKRFGITPFCKFGTISNASLTRAVCKTWDMAPRLVDLRQRRVIASLGSRVSNILFSPDGTLLSYMVSGSDVVVRKASDGKIVFQNTGRFWTTLKFSPDGRYLLVYGISPELLRTADWKVVPIPTFRDSILAHAFSPDGKLLFFQLYPNELVGFRTNDGSVVSHNEIRGEHLTFSPDGRLAATVDDGGIIRLWDPKEWTDIAHYAIPVQSDQIGDVGFSPDARTLAVAGDGAISLFNTLPPGWSKPPSIDSLKNFALATVTRELSATERQHYLLINAQKTDRREILARRSRNSSGAGAIASCDKAASDPYDVDRRARGVPDANWPADADKICATALKTARRSHAADLPRMEFLSGKTQRNHAAGKALIRQAADRHYAAAERAVAAIISHDLPYTARSKQAESAWRAQAAADGDPRAIFEQGKILYDEKAKPDVRMEALRQIKIAGDAGLPEANFWLGAIAKITLEENPGSHQTSPEEVIYRYFVAADGFAQTDPLQAQRISGVILQEAAHSPAEVVAAARHRALTFVPKPPPITSAHAAH